MLVFAPSCQHTGPQNKRCRFCCRLTGAKKSARVAHGQKSMGGARGWGFERLGPLFTCSTLINYLQWQYSHVTINLPHPRPENDGNQNVAAVSTRRAVFHHSYTCKSVTENRVMGSRKKDMIYLVFYLQRK